MLVIRFSVDLFLMWGGPPLLSHHLRKLELHCLHLLGRVLDFSSCSELETLVIMGCNILCDKITSHSIKYLFIKCTAFPYHKRTCISIPSLVSLQIDYFEGKAPLLESMPSLQGAFIKCAPIGNADYCDKGASGQCCGVCVECCGDNDNGSGCVLLQSFSSATNMGLIADGRRVHIFPPFNS